MLQEVMQIEEDIANKASLSVYACKRMINYARDHTTAAGLDYIGIWKASMFKLEEIQEAFNTFDVKGNGKITANALQGVFKSLNETFTDEEVKEMIKVVGSNGEVNFNQFKNMMLMR